MNWPLPKANAISPNNQSSTQHKEYFRRIKGRELRGQVKNLQTLRSKKKKSYNLFPPQFQILLLERKRKAPLLSLLRFFLSAFLLDFNYSLLAISGFGIMGS
ncbi:uncharacterized protein A4U43_C08F7060 [Asparagus officinalis]|nr:uncharacterized protein A4U43_C08F7060 [Asparagus officinalis]